MSNTRVLLRFVPPAGFMGCVAVRCARAPSRYGSPCGSRSFGLRRPRTECCQSVIVPSHFPARSVSPAAPLAAFALRLSRSISRTHGAWLKCGSRRACCPLASRGSALCLTTVNLYLRQVKRRCKLRRNRGNMLIHIRFRLKKSAIRFLP